MQEAPKRLSRRELFRKTVVAGKNLLPFAAVSIAANVGIDLLLDEEKNTPPKTGDFLVPLLISDRAYAWINQPIALKADFITKKQSRYIGDVDVEIEGISTNLTNTVKTKDGKIPLFSGPKLSDHREDEYASIKDLQEARVVAVMGDGFVTETNSKLGGVFEVSKPIVLHNGKNYQGGGIWFALANSSGEFVNPNGQLLTEDEKPYYIPSAFVQPKSPNQP